MWEYFERRRFVKQYIATIKFLDNWPYDTELHKKFIGDVYEYSPRWIKSVVANSYEIEVLPDGRERINFVKHSVRDYMKIIKMSEGE